MLRLFVVYFIILIYILTADGSILNALCNCTKLPDIQCNCTNPVLINPPTNIVQCYSRFKFYDKVKKNFNLQYKLLVNDCKHRCDYTEYKKLLRGMEKVTKEIIAAYFQCRERNCTSNVLEASAKYKNYSNTKFIPFILCAYTFLSPECAANINFVAFSSVENVVTTLLTCAKLKAECQRPDYILLFTPADKKDCNCVETGTQPIPASEEECFSPEFAKRLRCYIADSFTEIEETNHNASIANPGCNYCEFEDKTKEMKNLAIKWLDILEDCHPTFDKFNKVRTEIGDNARALNAATSKYILENDEVCSFSVRAARQSSLSVLNYVYQALIKCVQYKDPTNSICLPKQSTNE